MQTHQQLTNIANGIKRIKEKANHAYHEMLYAGIETGTFYSKRLPRTYRGVKV